MERFNMTPRSDYREKIEALGFDFHGDYWREEAYYRFTPAEIERLEEATREAYRMYCEAAEYIISEKPDFMERMLQIPAEVCERICESWNRDELSLYGRFDFLLDEKGVPRILEFNADTPTSLLEASVIQWQWKEECFPECDQYNGIHEGLVQSWKDIFPAGSNIHFVGALDDHEDTGTLQYLASTAMEAGYSTRVLDINSMNLQNGLFYDPSGECIQKCFKLYPWEWMIHALLKETEGDYNTGAYVYQEYVKPVAYSGRYPVIGSWIVGGEPAGIGIRENRTEITDNLSEFVPHIISCL